MIKKIDTKNKNVCDECGSAYYTESSPMAKLCPECASILYGYQNCKHHFENGRCTICFWDGRSSNYLNH